MAFDIGHLPVVANMEFARHSSVFADLNAFLKLRILISNIFYRTETEYVSQILTMIKRFAQHHSCHVWFVAHPRQVGGDKSFFPIECRF